MNASTEMTNEKTDKDINSEKSSLSILCVPQEILIKFALYAIDVKDTTNLLSTNSKLFSQREYVMSSVVKEKEREDAFEVFSQVVISGNKNAVNWFVNDPRFKGPRNGDNGDDKDNDASNDDTQRQREDDDDEFDSKCDEKNTDDDDNDNNNNNDPFIERTFKMKDEYGNNIGTALHLAAYFGHKALVDELIILGTPVMAKNVDGCTALHWAANRGHKEVVVSLFERGVDVGDTDDYGSTPLHHAAYYGQKEVVVTLLECWADIADKDVGGCSALHHASENGHKEIVVCLLEHGADIAERDSFGVTALDLARNKEIATIIQNYDRKEKEYNNNDYLRQHDDNQNDNISFISFIRSTCGRFIHNERIQLIIILLIALYSITAS